MTEVNPERALAIVNPGARVGAARAIAALERHLPPGAELIVHETRYGVTVPLSVIDIIDGVDLVVAIGGDGIVSQAAAAIDMRLIPLGIMPGGSTNMIAKVSGIPANPDAAARLIFGPHKIEMIDVGVAGDRRLLHAGGAGYDARIFERTSQELKKRIGWIAYLPSAVISVNSKASRVQIKFDDEEVEATSRFVFICNSASLVFPGLNVIPDVGRNDGLLDVLVFTANDPFSIGATMTDFFVRGLQRSPHVIYRKVAKFSIQAEPPMPVELDGDLIGTTPLQMHVQPRSLGLIVPLRRIS